MAKMSASMVHSTGGGSLASSTGGGSLASSKREGSPASSNKEGSTAPSNKEGYTASTSSPKRPDTAGTELLLVTDRRTASAKYLAAQRAEKAYKAKKRTAGVAKHRVDAKAHFRQSAHHLNEGMKSSWRIVATLPWMARGWKERRVEKKELKSREKEMEKKRKSEERIARQAETDAEKERENEKEVEVEAAGIEK
ncbi:hypothetical protein K504DRAFT_461206 [Pleomassaria siparia CBS 279.74]|uniref:Uncharacterized protein n=1 Tax=Pleomassaria siparia CBS 279.74 TaxID=1314801 RepID=A0A6G1JV08_9PLEO|nr:hypothetical protein K504DRAFT_461206 [Pleomassaria siparia CBS 279.74]